MIDPQPALLFCDLETTGLDVDNDIILEAGFTLVDKNLDEIVSIAFQIQQNSISYNPFDGNYEPPFGIHRTVVEMHTHNRLWEACYRSKMDNTEVYNQLLIWFQQNLPAVADSEKVPICGNTVGQFDVQFLRRDFPRLMEFVHYRVLDISSIKIANNLWGDNEDKPTGNKLHRALPDIQDSLMELRYYRKKLWNV